MTTLAFRVAGRAFAIDAREVASVQASRGLPTPPGAPAGVLGVAAFRGEVVTVVGLPELAGDASGPGSILRLAAPREHLALWVPGPVALAEAAAPDAVRIDLRRVG